MQRAGQHRPLKNRATSSTPPAAPVATGVSLRLLDVDSACDADTAHRNVPHEPLEAAIRQRIESRLLGRVRNLTVRTRGGVVTLEGECTTYYTKQLAQHAAMGVLEDEHLQNAIVVRVPK
jgi:osmotically-inducible protein OsmY